MELTKKQKDVMKGMDDFFNISYANEMLEHLDKVNMDPWFYVYSNYVNPPQKKGK